MHALRTISAVEIWDQIDQQFSMLKRLTHVRGDRGPESPDRARMDGKALLCAAIAAGTNGLLLEVHCERLGGTEKLEGF